MACVTVITKTQKGSGMLAAMVSTTAGLMFCLLFYNLTLYNGAKTAVDSAVRKAIRCVTPTDPECVEYRGNAADLELRWRGIKEGPGSERHFIEKHNYDASMIT